MTRRNRRSDGPIEGLLEVCAAGVGRDAAMVDDACGGTSVLDAAGSQENDVGKFGGRIVCHRGKRLVVYVWREVSRGRCEA